MRLLLPVTVGLLCLIPSLAGGCRALSAPEEAPRSTPARPLWSEEGLREHLQFFNGPDVAGRATGTAGYATAATYVAARMAEFGLQPALEGEFRLLYYTPLNDVRAASLVSAGLDTLAFYPGVDFLPDGRSDSGRVQIPNLVLDPGGAAPRVLPGRSVLLPAARASTAYLQALRAAGARVVFSVGALDPRPAAAPIKGLLVVQLAPWTAARLMEATPTDNLFDMDSLALRRLPRPVRLRVETRALPLAGAVNVVGYVPGRHPAQARELVIVCVDLDAVGTFAGVPTLEPAYLGDGAAALLEAARQYAFFAQYTSVPERSLLFAVFSGARQGNAGLRAYLRRPLWPLRQTRAVVYVGLDPSDEPAVRDLLAAHGLPLYAVAPPADTLRVPRTVLLPERRPPRGRTLRSPGQEDARAAPPRLPDLIEAGALRARRMAEAVHALLLREAMPQALVPPNRPDTLRIPVAH